MFAPQNVCPLALVGGALKSSDLFKFALVLFSGFSSLCLPAHAKEYDRAGAILEIEYALYFMGFMDGGPDRVWDAKAAQGLAALRQRIVNAGI
ncbi:MAG: hypothetical protein WBC90_10995 [Albidovulum sp.]